MSELSNDGLKDSKDNRTDAISDNVKDEVIASSYMEDDDYYDDEPDYSEECQCEECQREREAARQAECQPEHHDDCQCDKCMQHSEEDCCEECIPVKIKTQKCIKKAKVKAVDCHIKVRPKKQENNCGCNKCKPMHNDHCVTTQCLTPSRSLLKCGIPGAVTLPLATVAGTTFTIASANVDTCGFQKPCVLLDFAVNVVTTAAILTLDIQIFRVCEKQLVPIPVGPIYTFSRLVAVTSSDAFNFSVCDCGSCTTGCCSYLVVATVAGVATVGVTTLSNATLSVLVEENTCNC